MLLPDSQLTSREVLQAFHRDEPYLFLGAAFTTVALVAGAFGILRRRFDALLFYFALFAFLYGQRLWLQADVLTITLEHNDFFFLLRNIVNYIVPIPAFFYFQASGLLGRHGKALVAIFSIGYLGLILATLSFGIHREFLFLNSILAVAPLPWLVASLFSRSRDRDFAAIRPGLIVFVACLLWDNLPDLFSNQLALYETRPRVEPYGFAVFLASLGYVAARRTLRRDQELGSLQQELELARRIQLSILPNSFPESAHFQIAARYVPMTSVAGDFYDFLCVEDGRAGILIADVSSHGVPAALIASMVKMAASSQRSNIAEPAQLLTGMNAALCGNTQKQFVTAAYVHLDARDNAFRYAAAGHPPMLLLRKSAVTEIVENGFVLAMSPTASFTQLTYPLIPGDRLVLYTDGILEARNAQGNLFGEARLHAIVQKTSALAAADTVNQIVKAVEDWSKSQDDDLTVIVCDFATGE